MTGTFTRNTEPHQKCSSSNPPSSGPSAPPAEKLAIHTPTANVRSRGSRNIVRSRDSVEGASVADARPRIARDAISMVGVNENAASMDAAPKTTAPMSNKWRRPTRSPRVPMVIKAPAITKP